MTISPPIKSDVQDERDLNLGPLNWVGMGRIQSMVNIGEFSVPCELDLGVNLKSGFRGIHMSRLYQAHHDYFLQQRLNSKNVLQFLTKALESQAELSDEVSLKISLQMMMHTQSLKSALPGFRNYPLQIICQKTAQSEKLYLQFEVLYSSTCPQSAGLSMEILNSADVKPDRLLATPHAQRSRAVVQVEVRQFSEDQIKDLIVLVETALKTPVQTAVKKADEMAFARLNAQNLMFCEDAGRIVAEALGRTASVVGFSVYCEHQESLHPHNASSLIMHNFIAPKSLKFA